MSSGEIGRLVRQIPTQYPFVLVDRILEHGRSGLVERVRHSSVNEHEAELAIDRNQLTLGHAQQRQSLAPCKDSLSNETEDGGGDVRVHANDSLARAFAKC